MGRDAAGRLVDWTRRRLDLVAAALLVLAVLGLHGHGLTLGFWFDDHNHLERCHQNGFHDLAGGNRFDWTGRLARVWWAQKATGWAYFRPLTVALRTTLYQLFGLRPLPFHVVHLALYTLSVLLLYGLIRRCGGGSGTALLAGLFFTLHPSHALTAPWLANDGPVLVGVWTFLGLGLMQRSAQAGHGRPTLLVGIVLCYVLALLSRENGIMLGPMLVLFDVVRQPAAGRTAWRRRLVFYAVLAGVGLTFLPLRSYCLGPAPAPRSPYFHWPTEPGFLSWLPYKVLNDTLCLPLGLPAVPITAVPWLQDRPITTLLAALALAGVAAGFLLPLWRSRLAWGLVAATGLALAPTLLAFSAPYNFYLASAGWAVLLAWWARRQWPARPCLVAFTCGALALSYLAGSWSSVWLLHAAATAERSVRQEVLATNPARYPPGACLFFINLPFFAAESGPALRLATDRPDLAVYLLTLSPELFVSRGQVFLEQEDEYTLRLRTERQNWFSGAFGEQVQLGWFGTSRGDLSPGPVPLRPAAGELPFRVEIIQAEEDGISELRFIFERPLSDPRYRFFVGLPWRCARPVDFTGAESDSPDDGVLEPEEFSRLKRMQMAYERVAWLVTSWRF